MAVVIAGGERSRLKPLSNNKPKAMLEINGHPMLDWVLRWLKFHGVQNVVPGVAYKKEKILAYMKANKKISIKKPIGRHAGIQVFLQNNFADTCSLLEPLIWPAFPGVGPFPSSLRRTFRPVQLFLKYQIGRSEFVSIC